MTRVLIIGGGGMLGQKLAYRLARDGLDEHASPEVTLFDMGFPEKSAPGRQWAGNLTDGATLSALAAERFEVIFHLAAIVSGESESDFD